MNIKQLLLATTVFTSFGASLFGILKSEQEELLNILKNELPKSFLTQTCSNNFSNQCRTVAHAFQDKGAHLLTRKKIKLLEEESKKTKNEYSKNLLTEELQALQASSPYCALSFLEKTKKNTPHQYKEINDAIFYLLKNSGNLAQEIDIVMDALDK